MTDGLALLFTFVSASASGDISASMTSPFVNPSGISSVAFYYLSLADLLTVLILLLLIKNVSLLRDELSSPFYDLVRQATCVNIFVY